MIFVSKCMPVHVQGDILTFYDNLISGLGSHVGEGDGLRLGWVNCGLTGFPIYGNILEAHQGGLICILLHFSGTMRQ